MTYTGLPFTGKNAVAVRPADRPPIVSGPTWARDRSQPGAGDGTELDATFLNRLKANFENAVVGLGGSLTDGDNQLRNAILAQSGLDPYAQGALADNDHDDAAAINAAIALAVLSTRNRTVRLRGTTYRCDSPINLASGVVLEGEPGATLDFSRAASFASGAYDGLVKAQGSIGTAVQLTAEARPHVGGWWRVASGTRSGTTATLQITGTHDFAVGDLVWIEGSAFSDTAQEVFLTSRVNAVAHTTPAIITAVTSNSISYTVGNWGATTLTVSTSVFRAGDVVQVADNTTFAVGDLVRISAQSTRSSAGETIQIGEMNYVKRLIGSTMIVLRTAVRERYSHVTVLRHAQNSQLIGAAAGAPGIAPAIWNISSTLADAPRTIALPGSFTVDGVSTPAIDVTYNGTATSLTSAYIDPASGGYPATAVGDQWTWSANLALISGSLVDVSVRLWLIERDAAGAPLASTVVAVTPTGSLGWFSVTRTVSNPATTCIDSYITVTPLTAGAIHVGLRICGTQLEAGASRSTFALTGTSTLGMSVIQKVTPARNVGVRNVKIVGKGPNTGSGPGDVGLYLYACDDFLIENVAVARVDQMAIKVRLSCNGSIERCGISFAASDEAGFASGELDIQYGIAFDSCQSVLIANNQVWGGRHAIVETNTATSPGIARDIVVAHNICVGQWLGAISTHMGVENLTCASNQIHGARDGFDLRYSRNTLVADNRISGVETGIYVHEHADSLRAADNMIECRKTGILCNGAQMVGDLDGLDLCGNSIRGGINAIYVEDARPGATARSIVVDGNTCTAQADDAIWVRIGDLAQATDGWFGSVSGNTIIDVGQHRSGTIYGIYAVNPKTVRFNDDTVLAGSGQLTAGINIAGAGAVRCTALGCIVEGASSAPILVTQGTTGHRTDLVVTEACTIAAGAVTATFVSSRVLILTPESGTADDLDTVNGLATGMPVVLRPASASHTITVRDQATSGTGNIQTKANASRVLAGAQGSLGVVLAAGSVCETPNF